jgi:3-oxoacyl-[acyl-carrier protein] reductase
VKLRGVRALVTGGSRGIGRAIAEAFAEEGAQVLALARSVSELEEVEKIAPDRIHSLPMDLLDPSQIDTLSSSVAEVLGGLDVLVNNAGMWLEKPFLEYTREDWDRTLGLNLTAVFDVTQALLPMLLESASARVINLAAIDGEVGFPKLVAQCASKSGLVGLTRALAKEFWDRPITINAICPAAVDKTVPYGMTPERVPGPTQALPWDVARAAVYLASAEGRGVNGTCLDVHGVGFLAS